jgi:hypothetical protein
MKEEDKPSTSFITPFGTYFFVRMPEGLKNAGSTFSRLTKKILEDQMGRNIFTYVDCWGPSYSEGPQKHDLTMFSK